MRSGAVREIPVRLSTNRSWPWTDVRSDRLKELGIHWVLLAISVWVASNLVDGITLIGIQSTLAVALILGLLHLYVRPPLRRVSMPVSVFTLGAFLIVINAVLLGL